MQLEAVISGLAVLGSTGSIGTSTLDVVARHPDKYRVVALTAYRQDELLFEQCQQFKPSYAVLLDEDAAARLTQRIATASMKVQVLCGEQALEEVASLPEVDAVIIADQVVGKQHGKGFVAHRRRGGQHGMAQPQRSRLTDIEAIHMRG